MQTVAVLLCFCISCPLLLVARLFDFLIETLSLLSDIATRTPAGVEDPFGVVSSFSGGKFFDGVIIFTRHCFHSATNSAVTRKQTSISIPMPSRDTTLMVVFRGGSEYCNLSASHITSPKSDVWRRSSQATFLRKPLQGGCTRSGESKREEKKQPKPSKKVPENCAV